MADLDQPQIIRVNHVDLAYISRGWGESIVLVHGSLDDYRSWRQQIPALSGFGQVIAYSRRYHWPNTPPGPGDRYMIRQHAADLAALIEALDLEPAHLIGSSYGALTALTCAVERPELARSLVLGEPPLLPWLSRTDEGSAIVEAFEENAFRPAGAAFASGELDEGVRRFITGVIGPGVYDRIPADGRALMRDNAPEMRLETASSPEDYFPDLSSDDVGRLAVPVLLIEGSDSPRMFGAITNELASALPRAERVTISGASHGIHEEEPGAYNAIVGDFLRRH